MNKKITGIYQALILCIIAICIWLGMVVDGKAWIKQNYEEKPLVIMDEMLSREEQGDTLILRGVLPQEEPEGKNIAFYSSHAEVRVEIGGEDIYTLQSGDGIVRTTGYVWNQIRLQQGDAGKEIVITLHSVYGKRVNVPQVLYGYYKPIAQYMIQIEGVHFVLSTFILMLGLLVMIVALGSPTYRKSEETLRYFAVFTTLFGIWYIADSKIITMIHNEPVLYSMLTHICLMLIPTIFVKFMRNSYQNRDWKGWNVYCHVNNAVILIRLLLQMFGISDLKQTLLLTHLSIFGLVLLVLYITIREIREFKLTHHLSQIFICVAVVTGATLLDLLLYQIRGGKNSSLGTFGFLFYIFVMGYSTIKQSKKNAEKAREAEIYRKLAYTDELTGLYSRTAFQRDLESREEGNAVIYMLDLNDLKKCNDVYGHENGDEYLRIASRLIYDTFGLDGRCYRIGGDEFCVLTPYVSGNEIENKMSAFQKAMAEVNKKSFVIPIRIAVGYGIYLEKQEKTMDEAREEADKMMYENKRKLKSEASQEEKKG